MNKEIFDCVIIGGGVIGCSIARYLSRFKLNGLLIEKHSDVGEETSSANSAIVHSGYDPLPNTLKAKFNVLGNKMMGEVAKELSVSFIRNGSLTLAFNDEEDKTIIELFNRAKENNVDARIINKEEILEMVPNISNEVTKALYCKDCGIISPFELTIAFMENAMDNGFKLKLNSKVINLKRNNELYEIYLENNEVIYSKSIVDAAGVHSDTILSYLEEPKFKIIPRKGEYLLLDHFDDDYLKYTLFMCPTKFGKGVLFSPTTSKNYIVGPSNNIGTKEDTETDTLTLNEVKKSALKMVPNIPFYETIRTFSGIRANPDTDDFIIEESKENKLFFIVGGMMSPGLASSPAIGKYVSELIKKRLSLKENESFNPIRRKVKNLKNLGVDEYNKLIKADPRYGRMVCRCEKVSEGEIVDCINRNCGAKTIKGVKRRVRPGFGKCQGTFCQEEVIKILSRELNIPINKICYDDLGSEVMKYPSKGDKYE